MVKKLFKHEVDAYLRTILPMHIILLGIALIGRIIQFFESDTTGYNILFVSSIVAYCVSIVVCIVLTLVFGIKRFYTNLFTTEGYLTLTLPVTAPQHIWVKTFVAVLSQLFSLLMIFISLCCITMGEVCVELFKAIGYVIKEFYNTYGYHATLYIIETIIGIVVSLIAAYQLYYACISLGQRAKKNRVGAAVGVFFAYYLIVQIIATALIIVFTVNYEAWNLQKLFDYFAQHPILTNHLLKCAIIVIDSLLILLYYTITRNTITKKLNLE